MSSIVTTVCNYCQGIIPADAQRVSASISLHLAGGEQPFGGMDFCCTGHLAQFMQAQPLVPAPPEPYPPIPQVPQVP